MRPYSGLKSQAQIFDAMALGIAQGRRTEARSPARATAPSERASRRSAKARPRATSAPTETSAKYAVVPSALQKRPSCRRKPKLARPMKRSSWKTRMSR